MANKCECRGKGILQPGWESDYHPTKELPFVNHEPGECKCVNELRQYHKHGKKVWLCSNCEMGETPVSDALVSGDEQ